MPSFMENIISIEEVGEVSIEDIVPVKKEIKEPPEEIKIKTAEELAEEMASFLKKEFPEDFIIGKSIYALSDFFWQTKGVDIYYYNEIYPSEIVSKIARVPYIAEKIFKKEIMEKEKAILSSLAESCIERIRKAGINKITKNDVEAFLIEKNVKFYMPETKSMLYHMVKAKTKK